MMSFHVHLFRAGFIVVSADADADGAAYLNTLLRLAA